MTQPRAVLNAKAVAARFGKTASWFYERRAALERGGFPAKDALASGWLAAAVDQWFDERAGTGAGSGAISPWRRRLRENVAKDEAAARP